MKLLKWFIVFLLGLLAFLEICVLIIINKKGYELNWSDSMPIGIYKALPAVDLQKGDIIAVCLPGQIGALGLERQYLINGKCSGGFDSVIKELIALPSDTVTLSNEYIVVGNRTYFAPLSMLDRKGRPLFAIPRGQYKNAYFLYGSNDPVNSWDSRYYGGVNQSAIVNKVIPVIMF